MDEHLELFNKILEEHVNSKRIQSQLMGLIECLYKDLEFERSSNADMHKYLDTLTKQESFAITSKYFAMKEQIAVLKKQEEALKNETDELNIQLIAKTEEMKRLILEKEEEVGNYYKNQMKQKEEEIKWKNEEIESSNANHSRAIRDLYNDMQASSAASILELREAECNWLRQLNDTKKKLKDTVDTCNILRTELLTVKDKFTKYRTESHERIEDLQRRLKDSAISEKTTIRTHDEFGKFVDHNSTNISEHVSNSFENQNSEDTNETSNGGFYRKSQPLEVTSQNISTPPNKLGTYRKPPVYHSFIKPPGERSKTQSKPKDLPSLIQLREHNDRAKSPSKKRKLYNPDDLAYLSFDTPNKENK